MAEKILEENALEQFTRDYQIYAIYSEMNRSVPSYFDGLVPVYRRVLYSAWKYCHAEQLMKCANIIGNTMAYCHPHGDSSIQSALYTMINWFQTKYPYFIGRGNFGNTFRNVPASPRYTETRISPFSYDCILDELIKLNNVVDWIDNYDKRSKEPLYLPSKVPLLLLNGSMHMSVGDKVDVPTHNLCEVVDQMIALIQNPKHNVVLVPDHCQACEIVDTDWAEISRRGYGHYKIRGIIETKEYFGKNKRYKGRTVLAIRSCPNLTYLGKIMEKIEKLVKDNKLIGIEDIEDESDIDDMNYVIILRPGTDPNFVKEALYQNTQLQQTFRVNMKVIFDNKETLISTRIGYTEYMKGFIELRKITKQRYYTSLIQKLRTRLHLIENYISIIESGKIDDQVIKIIRSRTNDNDEELMEILIKKCKFTDVQARFIMNIELKKLSKGYYKNYCMERDTIRQELSVYESYMMDEKALNKVIIDELLEIKAKYGDRRKCRIITHNEASGIPQGIFKITISEQNFIKKIGIEDNITGTKQGDSVKFVNIGDNSKSLLLFDINGKVYNLPISKIPFSDKSSAGVDIRVINKYIAAPIACVVYEPDLEKFKKGFIVTVTKQGYIKRMNIEDFFTVPISGLVYSKLDPNDYIVDMLIFKNDRADIVVYNHLGKALRIKISDIPVLKRNSRGNISMGGTNHEVIGMSTITHGCSEILAITSKGYINKITPEVIPTGRNKAGKSTIKLTKGDYLISVLGTNESSSVRSLCSNGQYMDIPANSIPIGSSISTGTRVNSVGFLKAWNL